ncbi:uncharacterized protein A4U43_C03F9400 [Asparagus officinalis]|uniref:FBD domain-containing protein n=1 Tax=Asparagus officinalis TaxID=4686 RepID=A0A5P1F8Q8_ASPOF|nr:F-box/FBD/LRR-repeat protein At1g13570-like [Asparagus officinalis]ONK74715.1 uncharacterized protein A4U43_C03F9400 [Asparagus officinalis]
MAGNKLPGSILEPFQSLSLSSTTVEFGKDFAGNKTPEEIAEAVGQFLHLHTGYKIDKFHLYFCPSEKFLPEIENWVAYVIGKGVENLNLDFSMEFDSRQGEEYILSFPKSLINLSLSDSGFSTLRSLSLSYVNLTGNKLQQLISNCPLLDALSIINCSSEDSVTISSQRLQKFTFVNSNWEILGINISTPNLESFIYHGIHIFGEEEFDPEECFVDISSLSDAFISAVDSSEPEHDFIKLVYDLRHVKVLTVCTYTLWRVTIYEDEKLPILLQNLKELQLLMCTMTMEDLDCIYNFFRLCPSPFLEKLFIHIPDFAQDMLEEPYVKQEIRDPFEVNLNHLKVVKMSNFKGRDAEMRLVKFLLQKVYTLEFLVLVGPKSANKSLDAEPSSSVQESAHKRINDMCAQLSSLPKASSQARVLICEHSEDDMSLTPTHTRYFEEY